MDTVRSAVKLEPNDLTCDDSCADASDTTDKFTADDDGDDEEASFHLVNLLIAVSCFAFVTQPSTVRGTVNEYQLSG